MLAMADRSGRVFGSIPGLANRARVTVEEAEKALERFKSPDKYSRTYTEECQGRRIIDIDGGWKLLNHAKYRAMQDEETIKEAKRKWWHENKEQLEQTRKSRSHLIQAEAEADTEAKIKSKSARKRATPLPVDFKVSDNVKSWALQKGFGSLEAHLEFFKGRMSANGKTYVDWDQAFMNCVREDWPKLRGNGSAESAQISRNACTKCGRTDWVSLDRYKVCSQCQERK